MTTEATPAKVTRGIPFGKGNPGKPKGATAHATRNAREAIAALVDNNAGRMQAWLDEIAREQGAMAAWRCMSDVIEYHIPKLARTELTGDGGGPVQVTVNRLAE